MVRVHRCQTLALVGSHETLSSRHPLSLFLLPLGVLLDCACVSRRVLTQGSSVAGPQQWRTGRGPLLGTCSEDRGNWGSLATEHLSASGKMLLIKDNDKRGHEVRPWRNVH